MARFREPFRSVLDDFRIRFEAVSISVYRFLECFLDPQKSINCIEIHRFLDHFWILFGSFWDPFWTTSALKSIDFWITFGSFLDHSWRLARSISIDLWIIFGGSPRRPPVYWVAELPSLVNGPPSLVSGPLRLGSGPPHSSAARLTQERPSRTRPCGDPQPPPTYQSIPIS